MLDPWIIEEIRRREEDERRQREGRPVLEIYIENPPPVIQQQPGEGAPVKEDRGVAIIDFSVTGY
jgi:hypothetical protein